MRRFSLLLCSRVLASGVKLDGRFDNTTNNLVEGIASMPDGRVYKGTFDKSSGRPLPGTQLEEDGDMYRGEFNERWQRSGAGEAFLLDGTHYKGTFNGDELVSGTVRIPDGSNEIVFEGTLKDESFKTGTIRQHDFSYTGEFEENMPHGKGTLTFASGAVQEGTFYRGKLHGHSCRLKLESGFLYVGEFNMGICKKGQLYTPTYHYDGEFSDDGRANGEGTQTFLAASPKLIFTGVWVDGSLSRGTCADEDGNPVDWVDNHDLRKEVMGASAANVEQAGRTMLNDVELRAIEMMEHDASNGNTATEPRQVSMPSAAGMVSDATDLHTSESFRSALASVAENNVNANLARSKLTEEIGCRKIVDSHMDEQLRRFQESSEGTEGNEVWRSMERSS